MKLSPKKIDKDFNFVVAGGGTAGWLTALFVKRYFPESKITLIQSPEIGILGAGEGTTPHIIEFLDDLNIPAREIIKYAKGTFKSGIKFTNWNGDGSYYFHPFIDHSELNQYYLGIVNHTNYPLMSLEKIAENENLDSITFSSIASYENKVKFVKKLEIDSSLDPILHFEHLGKFALHFDANLLAKYLEKVGIERGISVIDSTVEVTSQDDSGNINSLQLSNNDIVRVDFLFDCTGFNRVFIGNLFKSTWNSYKDHLPVNRALPFFIENTSKEIPPYTESIAMKHGWMWKIPVEGRIGCGYVFDSTTATDEEIKIEIEEFFGHPVSINRGINFEAGCYQETWINNCVAIGLSSGFIEPLEATSIWVTTTQLNDILANMQGLIYNCQETKDRYNARINTLTDSILSFIYFHYMTKREDTEFWKKFTDNNKMPLLITELIKESSHRLPAYDWFSESNPFQLISYYAVGAGLGFFDSAVCKTVFESHNIGITKEAFDYVKSKYINQLDATLPYLVDHYSFLEYLRNT